MSFLVGGLFEGRHAISWVSSIELGGVSVIMAWRTDVAGNQPDPAGLALGEAWVVTRVMNEMASFCSRSS